jgi:hypothetical protein
MAHKSDLKNTTTAVEPYNQADEKLIVGHGRSLSS